MRFTFLLVALLLSCSVFSDHSESTEDSGKLIEFKPPMRGFLGDSTATIFTYPFRIGKQEITEIEYTRLIRRTNEKTKASNRPITNISWFDAILYCNALSVQEGLDSVYRYTSVHYSTNDSSADEMQGLVTDYSQNGYRLPTEAEWEFASRGTQGRTYIWGNIPDSSKAASFSWFISNSGDTLHEACQKELLFDICDLSGNAMEWVDGWYSEIPKDSVIDYVGGLQPNSSLQRIVKGGSFHSSLIDLKLTQRNDIYDVFSNSRNQFIGFRIAQGVISSPHFSFDGGSIEGKGEPIKIVANQSEVAHFLGTNTARLVLINGSNEFLSTLDFSKSSMVLREAPESSPSFHPTISPNGKYIAFATKKEGQNGTSELYIRPFEGTASQSQKIGTGWIPRWSVANSGKDTLLLFSSVAASNRDSLEWSNGYTYAYNFKNGEIIASPQSLFSKGAFHDGTSSDQRFFVTGFTELRLLDKSTSKVVSLFHSPENGKTKEASTQACNVSISTGDKPLIAFLDFGYSGISTLTGNSYRSHEYAFFIDPTTKNIVDTIHVPAPWLTWEHLEWSNDPNFLIATTTDSTEQSKAVYLIRKKDHALLKVLEGSNILMPYLWMQKDSLDNPSPDSLFIYYKPDLGMSTQAYGIQLVRFWETCNSATFYALGSSRTLHGIDPNYFSSGKLINLGIVSADTYTLLDLWKNYLRFHAKKMKVLFLEISPDFMLYYPTDSFIPYFSKSNGRLYDSIHGYWNKDLDSQVQSIASTIALPEVSSFFQNTGFVPRNPYGFGESPLDVNPGTGYLSHPESWKQAMDSIAVALDSMAKDSIQVIAIIFPQNPGYSDLNLFGRYGPTLKDAKELMDSLNALSRKHPFFHIFDQHLMGKHDYVSEDATDYDHLSYIGAKKLTLRLDSIAKVLAKSEK